MKKLWHRGECSNSCRSSQTGFFYSLLAMVIFAAVLFFYKDLGTFVGKVLATGIFISMIFALFSRPSSWIPFKKLKKCPQCKSHWVDTYYLQGEISIATFPNSQFICETAPMSYVLHCRRCGFEHSSDQGTWGVTYEAKKKKAS